MKYIKLDKKQECFFRVHGLESLLLTPVDRLEFPYAWVGHMPFARVLVNIMKPDVIVELGTHTGNSFCTFCQAVEEAGLDTSCYGVDTWAGDIQAGFYGNDVYEKLQSYVEATYDRSAKLLRMFFDEALDVIKDDSIDLLHIDGLHTYEAVRHDYDTWKPKLSSRGVVLFHDTQVFDRGFGVHELWAELREDYPSFEFKHSHGLGVLLVGNEVAPELIEFVELLNNNPIPAQAIFERTSRLWLPDEAIKYQQRFGSKFQLDSMRHINCEIYLDYGQGYDNSSNRIVDICLEEGSRGRVLVEMGKLAGGLTNLRFDIGDDPISIREITANGRFASGIWKNLGIVRMSGLSTENGIIVFGDDPWIEFELPLNEEMSDIEFQLEGVTVGAEAVTLLGKQLARAIDYDAKEKELKKLWSDLAAKDKIINKLMSKN